MIRLTEAAREKIRVSLHRATPPRDHLRIEATVGNGRFRYHMTAVGARDVAEGELVLEEDGFRVVLDAESARLMAGTTITWEETLLESGFKFDNPNEPADQILPTGARSDLVGPVSDRVQLLLDSEVNPAITTHGGRVSLVDVREGKVYLAFGGGCHGCGLVDATLKQGIEKRIREVVPEVVEVIDTTDHSTGENPYYARS